MKMFYITIKDCWNSPYKAKLLTEAIKMTI